MKSWSLLTLVAVTKFHFSDSPWGGKWRRTCCTLATVAPSSWRSVICRAWDPWRRDRKVAAILHPSPSWKMDLCTLTLPLAGVRPWRRRHHRSRKRTRRSNCRTSISRSWGLRGSGWKAIRGVTRGCARRSSPSPRRIYGRSPSLQCDCHKFYTHGKWCIIFYSGGAAEVYLFINLQSKCT